LLIEGESGEGEPSREDRIAEELGLGQWCLPMRLSNREHGPLIDWDFTPQEVKTHRDRHRIGNISLPAHFIGRRLEMRRYKTDLMNGKVRNLLITGPGGQGKTALTYLKQSLAIRQQIGDKAGLCATLFNMGHIHVQNEQIQEALEAWVTVYVIAKGMNLAQALQALANLAPHIGLPEGLEGWEGLAQQYVRRQRR
jgi:hypothetical protein